MLHLSLYSPDKISKKGKRSLWTLEEKETEAYFGARIHLKAWPIVEVFKLSMLSTAYSGFLWAGFQLVADSWLKDVADYQTRIQTGKHKGSGLSFSYVGHDPSTNVSCPSLEDLLSQQLQLPSTLS